VSFILVVDNFSGYPDKFGSNCHIRANIYITEQIIFTQKEITEQVIVDDFLSFFFRKNYC